MHAATDSEAHEYRVEIDWRGETAYYIEGDRRVWLACMYWGGPHGSVSHIHGVWESADGRREPLTAGERAKVLQRVADYARKHHHIEIRVSEE
jgi:hypothetical protein